MPQERIDLLESGTASPADDEFMNCALCGSKTQGVYGTPCEVHRGKEEWVCDDCIDRYVLYDGRFP